MGCEFNEQAGASSIFTRHLFVVYRFLHGYLVLCFKALHPGAAFPSSYIGVEFHPHDLFILPAQSNIEKNARR
jgi:hypothetical protein